MRTKLTAQLRNVLALEWRQPTDVHFHTNEAGRPYVCDFARCDSARLSPGEVRQAR
jgi:hypothetical protein